MMKTLVVGALEVNCYIVWDGKTRQAVVIDPGGDAVDILDAVKQERLDVKYVINTHGHFDHVGADSELKKAFGCPVAIHALDRGLMADAHDHAVIFGARVPRQPEPDMLLKDNEVLKAGEMELKVIHTPGHTKGGVCLYNEKEGLLFTGDTLFAGSVGRTDFEGGSYEELMASIKARLFALDGGVKVFPGHGPDTTIGEEKETNPYLAGM